MNIDRSSKAYFPKQVRDMSSLGLLIRHKSHSIIKDYGIVQAVHLFPLHFHFHFHPPAQKPCLNCILVLPSVNLLTQDGDLRWNQQKCREMRICMQANKPLPGRCSNSLNICALFQRKIGLDKKNREKAASLAFLITFYRL